MEEVETCFYFVTVIAVILNLLLIVSLFRQRLFIILINWDLGYKLLSLCYILSIKHTWL